MKQRVLVCAFYLFAGLFTAGNIFAQNLPSLSGVATNVEISEDVSAGDIVSLSKDGLKKSSSAYDSQIYGVIAESPIISVEPKTDQTKAVVSSGVAQVKVSTANGNIQVGDFITTSTTAGVGQKATESGYVLGKAMAAFDGQGDSLISVSVEIGSKESGSSAPAGFLQTIVGDISKLRLTLAAILGVVILLGSVVAFIRLVNSGVVAMGRNPLARAQIMRSMFVSGFLVVSIMVLGLGGAVALIMLGK